MLSARRACMAGGRKPLLRAGVTARVRSRGDGGAAVGPGSGQPPQHQPRPTHLARARSRPHSLCTPGTALPNSASALDDGAAPDSDLNLAGARPRIRAQLERGTARHVLTLRSSGPCARRCVVSTVQLHTHACCVCAYNSSIKMWSVYAMSGRSVGGACGDLKYRVQCGTTCSIRRDGNLTHDTCRVAESGTAPHVRHHLWRCSWRRQLQGRSLGCPGRQAEELAKLLLRPQVEDVSRDAAAMLVARIVKLTLLRLPRSPRRLNPM